MSDAKHNLDLLLERIKTIEVDDGKTGPGETHYDFDDAMLDYIGDDRVRTAHKSLCPYFE